MKRIVLFLFVILFPLVNATSLSMSPQQIDFVGEVNEKICEEVTLKTGGEAVLMGEDFWAEEGYFERKLKQHNLDGEELKLDLEYPENVRINNKGGIEVCLTGKNKGNYHGVLLYRVEGKPVRVGIWMNASLEKGEGSLTKITGSVTGQNGIGMISHTIVFIVLLLIVFFLVRKLRK